MDAQKQKLWIFLVVLEILSLDQLDHVRWWPMVEALKGFIHGAVIQAWLQGPVLHQIWNWTHHLGRNLEPLELGFLGTYKNELTSKRSLTLASSTLAGFSGFPGFWIFLC
ncbi:hypothetical protein NE237_015444 [Protea cynaroides]|uniref:Uncharacterized protein n=1 Tax=Protea cynaroides TaxID=273540 RepID=A0A9Q0QR29_9MAGN|nr:hypothetical protein NE237_015444 [Protea cynaroides]